MAGAPTTSALLSSLLSVKDALVAQQVEGMALQADHDQKEAHRQREEVLTSQLSDAQTQCADLQRRLDQAESERAEAEAAARSSDWEANILKSKLQQAKAELETALMEKNSLQSELGESNAEREELRQRVAKMQAEHRLQMERLQLLLEQHAYLSRHRSDPPPDSSSDPR